MNGRNALYLIWSHEHAAWWRPDRIGYTPHIGEAGTYTFEEACDIVVPHFPPGEEVAVMLTHRLQDAREARTALDVQPHYGAVTVS